MSSAYKTLKVTDISLVPYLAKKEVDYTPCTADEDGFKIYKGRYTSRDNLLLESLDRQSVQYLATDSMFYQGFISQSNQSSSLYNQSLQALGASGSYQSDIRVFNRSSDIIIISVPQSIYGEKISPKSFKHYGSSDLFYLIDDGNGNIIDINNYLPTTLTYDSIYNSDFIYNYYQASSSIGNILYSEGLIIVTDPNYYCIFGAAPIVPELYEDVFLVGEAPKEIFAVMNAEIECVSVDYTTITLVPIDNYSFPDVTIDTGTGKITIDEADPLANIPGTYKIQYYVKSTSCNTSNYGTIVINIIDCEVSGITITIS